MSRDVAEFAFDLHSGLSSLQVSEFDDLQTVGMAASLAIHLKGLGEVKYEVLRKVSDHFMAIPSYALEKVLRVLEEVGFVTLTWVGKRIEGVIPQIPLFDDVYEMIGQYADSECTLNGFEQATLQILGALHEAPQNRDTLFNHLGIEKEVFARCISIGSKSGIVSQHLARGRNILISPYYFADNLTGLADAAAASGANSIKSVLSKVKDNQGWPLSMVEKSGEIGGVKLSPTEVALVRRLSEEGVMKPPTIKFGTRAESFVFTPRPGPSRLNAANREVYERAMALISAVRKGQLLPDNIKIKWPLAILTALRDKGYLGSNSDAADQYSNLVILRVGSLKATSSGRHQFHLNKTPENDSALNLAIEMLQTGSLANMEIDQEARIALTKGEQYIQSLISAKELKERQKQVVSEEANFEFEQLLMRFD